MRSPTWWKYISRSGKLHQKQLYASKTRRPRCLGDVAFINVGNYLRLHGLVAFSSQRGHGLASNRRMGCGCENGPPSPPVEYRDRNSNVAQGAKSQPGDVLNRY